jgi:hypothetical protein
MEYLFESFESFKKTINEGTTPQYKALIKRAKELGIETSGELYDLIVDEFDDESTPITGADFEVAKKQLKLTENFTFEEYINEMAMSPEEKKARRKERRAAKKSGTKLPKLTAGASAKAEAASGKSSKDDKLEGWLKSVETDDYQNRSGGFPRSGVPDFLQSWDGRLSAEFKNTDERTAKAWMERFCTNNGFKPKKVETEQTGDYRDDWVSATAIFK